MPRSKTTMDSVAAAHERVLQRMQRATPQQMIESLKRAGILTKSGRFAGPYREFEKLQKTNSR